MITPHSPFARLGFTTLVALVAALSFGCASTKTEKPQGELVLEVPKPSVAVTKNYKYVTRLGSHIPIRVPKEGATKLAPGASPVVYVSPEFLREINLRPSSRR